MPLEYEATKEAYRADAPAEVVARCRPDDATMAMIDRYAAMADPYDPNNALAVALRASERFAKIDRTLAAMGAQLDRIANHVTGLPNRDDYDAVVADIETLRTLLRAAGVKAA